MFSRKDRTITRQDLADAVSRASGLPRSDAGDLVAQVLGLVAATVLKGEPVLLSGFGKFLVVDRAARRARNVRAGHEVMIGARRALVFKPAIGFVHELNQMRPAVGAPPARERVDFA